MYFLVKIVGAKHDTKLIIPIHWINNLDMCRLYNYGVNKKSYLMFYSTNDKEPDFSLPRSLEKKDIDFCFIGKMKKCYGMYK